MGQFRAVSGDHCIAIMRRRSRSVRAEEAGRAAKTVLEFLDEEWEGDPALEGEARMLLAQAQRMAGDFDASLKEGEAAIKVFEREKQPARAVSALLQAA